jgi:hypothetical protein
VVKTNAVRALDNLGIKYELREYEVDAEPSKACCHRLHHVPVIAARVRVAPRRRVGVLGGDHHLLTMAGNQIAHKLLASPARVYICGIDEIAWAAR